MTTVLRDRLYKIKININAFIDVVDINDASARVVACDELRSLIGKKFDFEILETELYEVEELPR